MSKKILIPIILGVALLIGIVFMVVYKQTSKDPFEKPQVETLAPKPTDEIITRTEGGNKEGSGDLDFEVSKEPPKAIIAGEDGKSYIVEDEEDLKSIDDPVVQAYLETEAQIKEIEERVAKEYQESLEAAGIEDEFPEEETITAAEMQEMYNAFNEYSRQKAEEVWEQALKDEEAKNK